MELIQIWHPLHPDKYKVKVTPPDAYSITLKDSEDDDSLDNDIDPTTGETDVFSIEDDNMTIDIGLYQKTYCLGDFIWYDNDNDGIQDFDGEDGVADVKVTLYDSGNNELCTYWR